MNLWEYDINKTIHNYSYTLLSSQFINRIYQSDEFADMDTESIMIDLLSDMHIVSFKDHLKRYLYLKAELKSALHKNFEEVTDSDYQNVITSSFKYRRAPYSMTPSSVRPAITAKRWLSQEYVKRSTIFSLGFGLGMTDTEVSEFLTKVINEEDFNLNDPEELIYWYCFHFDQPYAKAKQYLENYDMIRHTGTGNYPIEVCLNQLKKSNELSSRCEQYFNQYLTLLKEKDIKEDYEHKTFSEFERLYKLAQKEIAAHYNKEGIDKHIYRSADISAADFEKLLCCGIPVNETGNMKRKSSSVLSKHFLAKRMTRQTIDDLFNGKIRVNRFDLISLQFLISALRDIEMDPKDRISVFIKEIDAVLEHCHMRRLYSANAYESFILLCLLSEESLAFYSDILEYSYEPELLEDWR